MIKPMGMEFILTRKVLGMRELGKMISSTDLARSNGMMALIMRENSKMELNTVRELINGLTGAPIADSGLIQ